jgi:2-polyprenyl-3-methyl-5-hydroxy-6-metoxy-1,4-benzoquinol methylase
MKKAESLRPPGERNIPDSPIMEWDAIQIRLGRYVFAGQFVNGMRVLDIGCANGYGSNYLKVKGAKEVIAVDISDRALSYAAEHYQRDGLRFTRMDAEQLSFPDNSFDVVAALEVIEHLQKPENLLNECKRVLKENGTFICSTPNGERLKLLHTTAKKMSRTHVREFYIDEFRNLLAKYFNKLDLYGQLYLTPRYASLTKRYAMKTRMLSPLGLMVRSLPHGDRIANLANRFIPHKRRSTKLEELLERAEDFDRIVDPRYQPYPLRDNPTPPPYLMIAVAK